MRGPLLLLGGLLFVACECGNSGGSGCDLSGIGGGGGSTNGCGTSFGMDGGGYGGYGAADGQAGGGGCRFGFDSCGQAADCATSLREDANCGECGHTCGPEPCNNGACGADTLLHAGAGRDVTALLAAGNRLYYAESSELSRIGFLDPSGATDLVLLSGSLDVSELARGGGRIFALEPDHDDVLAMDDSSGAQLAPFVTLGGDAEALVADDSYAYVASTRSYYSDAGLDASFTEAGVLEAGVDASTDASFDAQSDVSTASDATGADALESSLPGPDAALDADAFSGLDAASEADAWYDGAPVADADATPFTDAADAQAAAYSIGRVQRVPVGGGASEAVIVEPGRARSLALANSTLFVGYSGPGRLYAIDTTTLGATLVAEGDFDPARLAVEGSTAYAADAAGQRVLSIELSSGVVQVVTQTPSAPYDVRADGGQLWFTTADPGQLYAWQPPNEAFVAGLLRPRTPIAVDPQYLYWSSPGTGILRVAR